MGDGGKGSKQRPGVGYGDNYDRIFGNKSSVEEEQAFNQLEVESRARMMAVQYALDRSQVVIPLPITEQELDNVLKQHTTSPIPLITDEEWAALNKDYE